MRITFLHGFLGNPLDWKVAIQALPREHECHFHPHPQAHLHVGYSMGGRKLLTLWGKGELQPQKLALIGTHPGLETSEEREQRRSFESHWLTLLEQETIPSFLKQWYAQPLFCRLKEIPPQRFLLTKEEIRTSFLENSLLKQPPLWEQLRLSPIPLLYIVGEEDAKYRKVAERLALSNPRIQIAIVKSASHAVHLEQPVAVAELLKNFLLG